MSQSAKKLRKAFLNELCEKFGIDNSTDPRRSKAALAFIAFGERSCREWLAQADGNYAIWQGIVESKRARKKAQKNVLLLYAPKVRMKQARKLQQTKPEHYFQYTVGADGAVTTWTQPSPDEEYRISNRN